MRDVAGDAGAEITRTGADEERVERLGCQIRQGEGLGERLDRERRSGPFKVLVQGLGSELENPLNFGRCQMALFDTGIAMEDRLQ